MSTADEAQQTMKVGTGMRRITPPLGTAMAGFAFRTHGCEGAYDDLYVRCLWLENGEGARLLILALDLCILDFATIDQWKQEIEQRWGFSGGQVLINVSHTHSGPLTVHRFYQTAAANDNYMLTLRTRVMEAVAEAAHGEAGCTIYSGQSEVHFGVCRRYPDGDGVKWAPYPGGYVERNLTVLTVKDRNGQPICVLFSASAHPSILTDYWLSAEYPGAACQSISAALGGRTMAMFLQGAAGDVKVNVNADVQGGKWLKSTYTDVKRSGAILASAVLQVVTDRSVKVKPLLTAAITMAELPVGLPTDPADYESFYAQYPRFHPAAPVNEWAQYWLTQYKQHGQLPRTFSCPVQVMRIGSDIHWLAFGGELTSGLARQLRAALPESLQPVFLGYSNGVFGYLPSEQMVQEGGYESMQALVYSKRLPAPFAPGMENALAQAVLSCLS